MTLRRYALTLFLLLAALCAGALTLDELQEQWEQIYGKGTGGDFAPLAQSFIEGSQDPYDLLEAANLWAVTDSLGYHAYLGQMLKTRPNNPKYRYLQVSRETDTLSRIQNSRDLVRDYPEFPGSYRVLLIAHLENLDGLESNSAAADSAYALLTADSPLLATYAEEFPEDKYASLADVVAKVMAGTAEAAKEPYRRAFEDSYTSWMPEYDLRRLLPLEKFHPLLAWHIELLRAESGEEEATGEIAERAGDLADYYFSTAQDYSALIDYFGKDPFYWQNQYVIYCLVLSQHRQGNLAAVKSLLLYGGNAQLAEALQDSWNSFNPEESFNIYTQALAGSQGDLLAEYLLARTQTGKPDQVAAGRKLIKAAPDKEFGYRVITDAYLNYFGSNQLSDSTRKQMTAALKKEKKNLTRYQQEFPESISAAAGLLLFNIAVKKDAPAYAQFKKLLGLNVTPQIYPLFYKFMADFDRLALLRKTTAYVAESGSGQNLSADIPPTEMAVLDYCQALLENGKYALMLKEVKKNPDWMDSKNFQFFLTNAHYMNNDYPKAIATLRLMVDKGSIGSTFLRTLEGDPMTQDPAWQQLVDYAASKPDPDAGMDSQE